MATEKNTRDDSYEDKMIAEKFAKMRHYQSRSVRLTAYPRYDR